MTVCPTQTKPWILLISAPSGAGKTTLCDQLLRNNDCFERVITCTTRNPRSGERDGSDYHFLSHETFTEQLKQGAFMEHAVVYDQLYGTRKADIQAVLNKGKNPLLNLDVQGAANLREQASTHPQARLVSVFLCPGSMDELERRLRGRQTESESMITKRLEAARREIEQWGSFDYFLESSSREQDLQRLQAITYAESMRTSGFGSPNALLH